MGSAQGYIEKMARDLERYNAAVKRLDQRLSSGAITKLQYRQRYTELTAGQQRRRRSWYAKGEAAYYREQERKAKLQKLVGLKRLKRIHGSRKVKVINASWERGL